jgi:FtsP/CotA-like multicopper oxidase with cupredoxin domain
MNIYKYKHFSFISLLFFIVTASLGGAVTEYNLEIAEESVSIIEGKPVEGMTINGAIPGPTLRFTEGDIARIHVENTMDTPSSIHWHGLLVPPNMDGVPFISFPPIEPGATFTYEFPIRQSGTYWYHSHSGLQEQTGLYGSIVIEPKDGDPRYPNLRDAVVLLSDWTNANPHEVLRTLRSGNEFYGVRKRSAQSIFGSAKAGHLKDYFSRELQRMPAMDLADVAYDQFLVNGTAKDTFSAQPGERVRLRIIDGSATTYFYLQFSGGPMTVIAADGLDVEPFEVDRLLIGVAETYDVLVTIPEAQGSYELRATAQDASGYSSMWIGGGSPVSAPDVPAPNLYEPMGGLNLKQLVALTPAGVMGMTNKQVDAGEFDQPGMNMADMDMGGMNMASGSMDHNSAAMQDQGGMDMSSTKVDHSGHTMKMNGMNMSNMKMDSMPGHTMQSETPMSAHSTMQMPTVELPEGSTMVTPPSPFNLMAGDISSRAPLASEGSSARPPAPYESLRSLTPTTLDPAKEVREIRLTLDGDMERYVWFINGKALSESDSIRIKEGEVVRFIMINRTMMNHPMHLHGHFFRVLNGQGDFAPLKHTVNVAPMTTTVIEFDANEKGDWFFHCHLLYHMHSGMARVVEYEDFSAGPETEAVRGQLYEDPYYLFGRGAFLSNMTEGYAELSNSRNIFRADWEIGWQDVPDVEWEGILTYARYMNRFTSVFAGADFLGEASNLDETRGVLGIDYTLPLNIRTRTWMDSDGGARSAWTKEFMLTPRLALETEVQYDTHTQWESSVGLDFILTRQSAIQVRWSSDFSWGAGLAIRF